MAGMLVAVSLRRVTEGPLVDILFKISITGRLGSKAEAKNQLLQNANLKPTVF